MKLTIAIIVGLILVIGLGFLMRQGSASATEKPDYEVVNEDDAFEIRQYPKMLLAEVQVTGDRDTAANRGFRKLAEFIFGDNVSAGQNSEKISMTSPVVQTPQSEKISMTSPVVQTPKSEKVSMTSPVMQTPEGVVAETGGADANSWVINFMMPSKYSMATLPKPMDTDIRIYESDPY